MVRMVFESDVTVWLSFRVARRIKRDDNHPMSGGYAKAGVEDRYGISRPPQIAARRAKRRLARSDIGARSMASDALWVKNTVQAP